MHTPPQLPVAVAALLPSIGLGPLGPVLDKALHELQRPRGEGISVVASQTWAYDDANLDASRYLSREQAATHVRFVFASEVDLFERPAIVVGQLLFCCRCHLSSMPDGRSVFLCSRSGCADRSREGLGFRGAGQAGTLHAQAVLRGWSAAVWVRLHAIDVATPQLGSRQLDD
uniref:Uncharacterized protein n=1 Tax=Streptomyces rochei TaxID=1928 RepID=Q83WW7_STRRO|nr:hypothetical protein [Streptomyces rochei]BAK19914.1 hypothetical protein [Streptomyces rochei]